MRKPDSQAKVDEKLSNVCEKQQMHTGHQHIRKQTLQIRLHSVLRSTKNQSLAHHRELLQKLRESNEKTPTCETESGDAMQSSSNEVGVELLQVEDADWTTMVPIDYATYLCDNG